MQLAPQSTIDLPSIKKLRSGKVREVSDLRETVLLVAICNAARDYVAQCWIIVADTKFQFGIVDGKLLLIDKWLRSDCSRLWPRDQYVVEQSPSTLDKQFEGDYLKMLDWNKTPPAPQLSGGVIERTSVKYREYVSPLDRT
jgi:phosphoribosylaminoimidazole-succinocarboxamide synthase